MKFIADFHIHSKYSRATAKTLDLEHLYVAAQIKGITVIGTGDFTHPAWFSEITEKLIPAEPGLYKLKDDLAVKCDHEVPDSCKQPVRFILTSEISNIYKKKDKTRKNHNLIFFPDLDSVSQFNKRLDAIGNINSDGRPILGLDAKHLLEIMLEVDDKGFLVPAHIWTPWFSLLGSKSGFNSIEECFEDLSPYIFAAETGLSSDPAMNWRLSALDGVTLISNSDAHSPFNLGREANRFDTELSYFAIKKALKTGNPEKFLGTFEFYPEEGKYHFDGHRKCNICYHPEESLKQNGICPVCNKPLTLGVLYRVEELADRKESQKPDGAHDYHSIIPLTDILSDIFLVGPKSKKVAMHFNQAITALGSEFDILHKRSIADLNAARIPLLGEAVHRMRTGKIGLSPGYDGEFGKVKIFTAEERDHLMGQNSLFAMSGQKSTPPKKPLTPNPWQIKSSDKNIASPPLFRQTSLRENSTSFDVPEDILTGLNDHQTKAVVHDTAPLIISAGPGTGKTKTLTHRIAHLILERKVHPESVLALTFTNKAAEEMRERLMHLLSQNHKLPFAGTFHGFCNDFLFNDFHQTSLPPHTIIDDKGQKRLIKIAIDRLGENNKSDLSVDDAFHYITTAKQFILSPDDELADIVPQDHLSVLIKIYYEYQNLLDFQNIMDYEDLILKTVKRLETDEIRKTGIQNRFSHIFVDEYQDLNHGQYRLIKNLSPSGQNLCVIGDPNQAIYGFRGSDPSYFNRFITDFSDAEKISLSQNYRSAETILEGSAQIIASQIDDNTHSARIYSGIKGIDKMGIICSPTEKSEAVAIGKLIEKMVGGIGFHSMDFGLTNDTRKTPERSFSDFAVLYRTHNQGQVIANILEKANIPCQIAQKETIVNEKGIAELLALFRLVEGHGSIFDMERVIRLPGSGISIKTLRTFNNWYFANRKPLYESLCDIRRIPVKSLSTASQLKLDKWIRQIFQIKDKLKSFSVAEKMDFLSKMPLIKHALDKNPKIKEIFPVIFNWALKHINDSASFCANLNLCHDIDVYDKRAEKVSLLTLHASKGLEFPVVFICGCEEGFIPYSHIGRQTNDSEEKRLFYVAMTRAKEDLYFSWAKKRNIYGKTENRTLSRFVTEIEEKLIRDEAMHLTRKKPSGHAQLTLF